MGKKGHVPKIKSKKKKKSPAKTEVKAAPLSTPDDVDEFVAGRHELKLHGNNYDDDEEEEDEVLALEGPDSDEEEEEDDEGEDGKFDDDEDEDEDEDAEATGAATAGWGRKKKDFYGGDSADDVSDEEAEEAARLEQEEVLRLQRDHAAGLEADDFGELEPSAEGDAADRPSDAQLLARLNEDLEAGAAGMNVEAVERDMSRLSEKEKLQLVEKQAPELLQLLGDFKGHMREVRERIAPLLAAARQKQLGQEGGVSFLELKLQLLLSYCVNISFYLLLKAQGRPVREHPVIDALLRHRLLIERLRPLDQKLKYRLQKLLQLASGADASALSESQQELQLRPNPDAMLLRNGDAADLEADGEEGGGGGGGGGAYRPPKLAAVPYEEEKGSAKRERQRQRQVQRASNSRLVRELRAEVSEEPETIHQQDFSGTHSAESGEVQRVRREEMEQREYEESNFTRLQLSKEAKREQRRRAARAGGAVNELDAFDDFSHLYNVATGSSSAPDPQEEKMRALQQYMNTLEQRGKKGRRSADEDTPRRDESVRAAKAQRRSAAEAAKSRAAAGDDFDEDGGGGGGGGGAHEEDPFYAQAAAESAAKRERKAAKKAPAVRSGPAEEMLDAQVAGETRAVGRDILKNRGLTRERNKADRNPRVKNKEKFRKAVISRGGQVRKVIAQDGNYAGETSGIKKNVSHSVRYK